MSIGSQLRDQNAYYTVVEETAEDGRYLAGPGTGGPWSATLQHGGPPGALLVRAAERAAAQVVPNGSAFAAVRLAADFIGPVPVAEIEVATRVVRAARTAVLVEATLSADGRPSLAGRVWLVRHRDTATLAPDLSDPVTVPTGLPDLGGRFAYHDTVEWQSLGGSLVVPGPGATWARPRLPLVPGEPMTGLQRVVLIGDSSSGISSELDWDEWSFVNVDLDVHLSRPVHGDWVLVDARTTVGTHGSALARSTVSDVRGEVGATLQTLVITARTPR